MDRRGYVVGCATILSGCVGGGGTPTATPRPPLPDSVERIVTFVEKSDLPSELTAEATVTIVEPLITTDHTARLQITLRNTGDTPQEYEFNPNPPMAGARSVSGPGTLFLSSPGAQEGRSATCWKLGAYQHGDGTTRVELDPDEAVRNTLEIWDVGEDSECLPPGEYTFATSYPRLDTQDSDTKWSFTLSLEKA